MRRSALLVGERRVRVRGVHSGRQAEAGGDPLKQLEELLALLFVEVRAQVALVAYGNGEGAAEQIAPGVGQVQLARATIVRVLTPFEQAACGERVDEGDHAAWRDPEPLADGLLGLAFGGANRA